jgi:hypothetical protein
MIFKLTPTIRQWLKNKGATEEVFDYMKDLPIKSIVAYLLNSSYRQAVTLSPWLEQMVETDTDASRTALEAIRNDFPFDPSDYDSVVLSVLKWAVMRFKYVSDTKVWKLSEYWQTSEESLALMTGDCEDGAILMYVLCRKLGVPANRLFIFAGDVWDGYGTRLTESYIKQEGISSSGDTKCQKDLKDFRKEIQYGAIRIVLQQGLEMDNDSLLRQSLKKVVSLSIKDASELQHEENECGSLWQADPQFVTDAQKVAETYLPSTTLIKIDSITLHKIWKSYVSLAMQHIMDWKETQGNSKKATDRGTLVTRGTGGHCWLGYKPSEYPLNWVFLDWCYWPSLSSISTRAMFYVKDKTIVEYQNNSIVPSNYYNIWFIFNEDISYLSLKTSYLQ